MTAKVEELAAIRAAVASLPPDVSTDAHGVQAPRLDQMYAPDTHAAALDPAAPVVQGSRGTGKSFWAGVLASKDLREAAAKAYPRLGLDRIDVQFGFTGLPGPEGIDKEKLDSLVSPRAGTDQARVFWWSTVLRALERSAGHDRTLKELGPMAADVEQRDAVIARREDALGKNGKTLLIVYDALDTVASTWDRRRILTQALLEVVWAMRAWRAVRPKLFLRPDQLDDEALRFVELPKLRTGAVRLWWNGTDLYGMLFARLSLGEAREPFSRLLAELKLPTASLNEILARRWLLGSNEAAQRRVMKALAGPYMAPGPHGYKKGDTYDWPLRHLADALAEVTPRSFLGLAIGAAKYGEPSTDRVFTAEGIRHGLRSASTTRVDQLHQEFPWIKGVLAPLAGLILPQQEQEVFEVWRSAGTVEEARRDARTNHYLPPFPDPAQASERDLYAAMERIGVMFRRKDGRLDMPDLFRVAAKLLKKGGIAPA